jgi:hypothetical protein
MHNLKAVFFILIITLLTSTISITYGQVNYTTELGKTIVIDENYDYKGLVEEAGAYNEEDSPFEQPEKNVYVLDPQEEKAIANLTTEADKREITAYIRLIKSQNDTTQVSTSYEQKYKQARQISKLVGKLPKVNADRRTKVYEEIDELTAKYSGEAIKSSFRSMVATDKTLKLDKRLPFDILAEDACSIVYDDYDESLKSKRKETVAARLFGFTHPRLRRHFTDRDYIETLASMAKIGRDYFLILRIDIASKSASKNYGAIPANERVRLKLVDGSNVYGVTVSNQMGVLEQYTGHTIYTPIIKIHKDDIKRLERIALDDVGILWTSGFENYEVYDIDILQNLSKCLRR